MLRRTALLTLAGSLLAGCAPEGKPQFKAVVVFFGYTQCPDVCPTTMTEIAEAKKLLGADGAKVQGVFITVDPERDTPEVLKAYMANFDPGFVALRGSPDQIAHVARKLIRPMNF